MELAPRSDDGSQRQEQDHDAIEQAALPKPSTGSRKMKLLTMVKDKSSQTFGFIHTTEVGVQANITSGNMHESGIMTRITGIIM